MNPRGYRINPGRLDKFSAYGRLVPADVEQQGTDDDEARDGQGRQHAGPKADSVIRNEESRLATGESEPERGGEQGADGDRNQDSCDPDDCDSEGELNCQRHVGFLLQRGLIGMSAKRLARFNFTFHECNDTIGEQAEVAQLVEQLIRNQQVVGSTPIFGSISPRGGTGSPSRRLPELEEFDQAAVARPEAIL